MTITWKTLGQQVLTGAAVLVYTAPSATATTITAASVWNPTGAPVTVDLFLVPSGGTAVDGTHIDRQVIPAASASTMFNAINHKLSAGASIYALGNGTTLTLGGAESV